MISLQGESTYHANEDYYVLTFSSDAILPYQVQCFNQVAYFSFHSVDFDKFKFVNQAPEEFQIKLNKDYQTKHLLLQTFLDTHPYLSYDSALDYQTHYFYFKKNPERPLFGKIIVIDPGHGSFDEKTLSIYDPGVMIGQITESSINLDIALMTKALLIKKGAKVHLTREKEYFKENLRLDQRIAYTNDLKPDIFVSIHQNASEYTFPKGLFVYYHHAQSLPLAQSIFDSVVEATGLKPNHILESSLYTLQSIQVSHSVMIECAFLSNVEDMQKLKDTKFLSKIAHGISEGILSYFANP